MILCRNSSKPLRLYKIMKKPRHMQTKTQLFFFNFQCSIFNVSKGKNMSFGVSISYAFFVKGDD